MEFFNKTRILAFIIILLLVTNISTIVTIYYHKKEFHPDSAIKTDLSAEGIENKGFVFNEKLDLSRDQIDIFRTLRQNYNSNARQLSFQMQEERELMVSELGQANSDSVVLEEIAVKIGNLHTELKRLTTDYYLKMKMECNDEQAQKLMKIFEQLLNNDGNVRLPQPGGHGKRGNTNN